MADLAVDTDAINSMVKRMSDSSEVLESSLSMMYESVRELNRTWEGPNHTAFVETFEQRYQVMEKLNQSMKKYVASVKKARKAYADCEEEVNSLVGRL